jgi:hypothetical protein
LKMGSFVGGSWSDLNLQILKNVQINSADRNCPSFSSIYK